MKNSLCWLLPVVLLVALFGPSSHAAEAVPGDACATAEHIRSVGGPETSGAMHIMVCQGGTWKSILSSNASGAATKIGNLTCNANDILKFNGTTWTCASNTGSCDAVPSTFDFDDQVNLGLSTQYDSNTLQIAGTDPGCNSIASITGDGSPQYRVCNDSSCTSVVQTWTNTNVSFDIQGKYVQLRATSPASTSASNSITMTIGTTSNVWTLSTPTPACGDLGPGDEGTLCPDGSVFAGISPDNNKIMYVARCDIGMSWDGATCTGARSSLTWNNGAGTGWVTTGAVSYNTGNANTANLYGLDSDSNTGGTQPHQAADACSDLNVHGQTDWYLPAASEAAVIYVKLIDATPNDNSPDPLISGFAANNYWTSTEFDSFRTLFFSFNNAGSWNVNKDNSYHVRCARTD